MNGLGSPADPPSSPAPLDSSARTFVGNYAGRGWRSAAFPGPELVMPASIVGGGQTWRTRETDFMDSEPGSRFPSRQSGRRSRALDWVVPTVKNNLLSTVNLLAAAAETGCHRFVVAGSMEEPTDPLAAIPNSPYAAAKSASTAYARMFHALYDLPVVVLRLFMVYGPGAARPHEADPLCRSFPLSRRDAGVV